MEKSNPSSSPFFLCFLLLSLFPLKLILSLSDSAHPSYEEPSTFTLSTGSDYSTGTCTVTEEAPRVTSSIIDITHPYRIGGMPTCVSQDGLGQFMFLQESMANGSLYNLSELRLIVHFGTHVDAPGHMYNEYFEGGFDIDTLDLEVLNGPALLVDVPRDQNITAEVMESLHIPRGVRRVLFRTLNTDKNLMSQKECDMSYVGFVTDGAQWLVDNTDIKLVGIDYLSVAAFSDLIPAHLVLLKSREIILVEALKLDGVAPGLYNLHCLPLRLVGAEGSPIRCILIK